MFLSGLQTVIYQQLGPYTPYSQTSLPSTTSFIGFPYFTTLKPTSCVTSAPESTLLFQSLRNLIPWRPKCHASQQSQYHRDASEFQQPQYHASQQSHPTNR